MEEKGHRQNQQEGKQPSEFEEEILNLADLAPLMDTLNLDTKNA